MEGIFNWLVSLPAAALYLVLGGAAALENFFPPVPADTVVALGSFLAARGSRSPVGVFLAVWVGNIGGALVMYSLGRRFGAGWLERWTGKKGASTEARLHNLYNRYGVLALFFSRFLPGARAIVPPFAGAVRIPFGRAAIAMGSASAIWYGAITYVGYTVGSDWHRITELLSDYGHVAGIVVLALALVIVLVWWVRRRKKS